ncbi:MAG: hypothetical protein HY010_01410 [Acidobacteria bacterium]|nr:hypothetical protein [Acidobacteriota bacterium]
MKGFRFSLLTLLALTLAIPAVADDEDKALKQLHKLTAMATDAIGRRVVSATIADAIPAKRSDLVLERRTMNINYGDLYVAHVLIKGGAKMEDIAAQMKAGKTVPQIASDQHADWKQIAADAKKLNSQMEDSLYKHFLDGKPLTKRDTEENYDPMIDGVAADNDISKADIADAEHTYLTWRDRAEQKKGSSLDASSEKAAQGTRGDPVRSKAGKLAPPP